MRKVTSKVLHYFPPHIKNIEEFEEISKAYDAVINSLWTDMGVVFDNNFFDTMDADECSRREQMLGIVPNPLDTLNDRRRRIKGYSASNLPYTEKKMHDVLSAMCGQEGYELVIDKSAKTLFVGIKLNSVQMVDNARELMRNMAPADMSVTAQILYNIHSQYRSMTHEEMGAYTHHQLRTDASLMQTTNMYSDVAKHKHSELTAHTHKDIAMSSI